MKDKLSLAVEAEKLTEFWSQRVLAEANGSLFKVAKGIGSTRWHAHDNEEETFYLLSGKLRIQLRDRDVELEPGDLFVISRGVEHCPVADEETKFLIIGTSVTSTPEGGKPAWSNNGGRPPKIVHQG